MFLHGKWRLSVDSLCRLSGDLEHLLGHLDQTLGIVVSRRMKVEESQATDLSNLIHEWVFPRVCG